MLIFLSVFFLVYGGMNLYALGRVWQAFPHSPALGLALVLWGIAMTLAPLLIWYMGKQNWHGAAAALSWVAYGWMGFLFLFCCIAMVFGLGHALMALAGLKWPMGGLVSFLAIALPALVLTGYGFVEAGQLQVEELKITTSRLASGKVTIAQISDLHLGMMLGDEFLDRIVARLREIKPDIIVATGDIVDGQGDNLNELAQHFLPLKPPMGAYAIIGNHESFAGLETSLLFFRNAGFKMLRGESAATGGIILVGVDDPSAGALAREISMETRRALIASHKDAYIVLLKHQPVVDGDIPFDLQLSGHIHGGQIFPFIFLSRMMYKVRSGLNPLSEGRLLYVSRGAGTWGPPIRFLAPPEITLITIESENK